jgi:hypothetical protein
LQHAHHLLAMALGTQDVVVKNCAPNDGYPSAQLM